MGLDISHDAFGASYSAFNRFRQAVAKAIGGSFPPHSPEHDPDDGKKLEPDEWYWGEKGQAGRYPGLFVFFMHSDCDGEIEPAAALCLADDLEMILPELDELGLGVGHIQHRGGYGNVARKMIAGCRRAAEVDEPLVFR